MCACGQALLRGTFSVGWLRERPALGLPLELVRFLRGEFIYLLPGGLMSWLYAFWELNWGKGLGISTFSKLTFAKLACFYKALKAVVSCSCNYTFFGLTN